MKLSEEAKEFLKMNEIEKYTINPDGLIDVDEHVIISTYQSKFPVKFGRVTGNFYCSNNQLTSLEGAPSIIENSYGYFSCEHNLLISLHDVHKHIKVLNGYFNGDSNPIKDSVLGLLLIKGLTEVFLSNKEIQKILNKYLGQGRSGVIGAQQELLDAGLDEYARL